MSWIIYLLKVSVCMVPFYLLFVLCLQRLTFFSWNRAYLLLSLAISWTIPLLQFELPASAPAIVLNYQILQANIAIAFSPTLTTTSASAVTDSPTEISWDTLLVTVYLCGATWILFRLLCNVWRIFLVSRKHIAIQQEGYRIIYTEGKYPNSSFFHLIFINSKDLSLNEQAQVLSHEKCHSQCRHSIDIIALEMIKAILWFNPIVYLYQQSLQLIHEFEADALTATQENKQAYAQLLLKMGTSAQPVLIHPFT